MIKSIRRSRKRYIARVWMLAVLSALCVGMTSCFGNKAPERTYFSIDYALTTQPKYEMPKYNVSVVLQDLTSALAYDRQEIVYRVNPYEFQYYWYRLWASKPRKMFSELIVGHLEYMNLFHDVSTTIEDRLPDYVMDVYIVSIEELDVSDTEWYAHLSLKFTLSRSSDSHVVWSYTFDAKRPVASNQPVYVVKAMSEIMDVEIVKAFKDLDIRMDELGVPRVEQGTGAESAGDESETVREIRESGVVHDDNVPSAQLKNKRGFD